MESPAGDSACLLNLDCSFSDYGLNRYLRDQNGRSFIAIWEYGLEISIKPKRGIKVIALTPTIMENICMIDINE